jgi:hypothetical protein
MTDRKNRYERHTKITGKNGRQEKTATDKIGRQEKTDKNDRQEWETEKNREERFTKWQTRKSDKNDIQK